MTRKHALILCLGLMAPLAPATAQETEDSGPSLMERGLSLFFDGFQQEMAPHLDDMATAMSEIGPALDKLLALVDDMTNYEMPEMLENGDILIRRKPDAPLIEVLPDQGVEL